MFLLKGQRAFRIIVLLAACMGALTSCERKGTSDDGRREALTSPTTPRIQKEGVEKRSWFCALQVEYSEATDSAESTRKYYFATAEQKLEMIKQFKAKCDAETGAAKNVCTKGLKSRTYKCVHESLYTPYAAMKGNWECQMEYEDTNGQKQTLSATGVSGETGQKTIQAAFSKCAAKGESCARAMMAKKMVCKETADSIAAVDVATTPPSKRVFR